MIRPTLAPEGGFQVRWLIERAFSSGDDGVDRPGLQSPLFGGGAEAGTRSATTELTDARSARPPRSGKCVVEAGPVSLRPKPLDERQLAVLDRVGDGCPDGPLAVPANKNRAQALANRGLVEVKRGKPGSLAVLTEAGRFYLDLGRYPEPPKPEPAETIDPPEGTGGASPPGRPRNVPDQPVSLPDLATVRRIARTIPGSECRPTLPSVCGSRRTTWKSSRSWCGSR